MPAPRPVLGCGGELTSTFRGAKGARAWVGHHIGALTNADPVRSYDEDIPCAGPPFAVEPGGRRPRPPSGVPLDRARARPPFDAVAAPAGLCADVRYGQVAVAAARGA